MLKKTFGKHFNIFYGFEDTADNFIKLFSLHRAGPVQNKFFFFYHFSFVCLFVCLFVSLLVWWAWWYYYCYVSFSMFCLYVYALFTFLCVDIFALILYCLGTINLCKWPISLSRFLILYSLIYLLKLIACNI